ncbi:calcium/sodium antiporter [Oculatella sp. LEGE 06141]|uniref:calcium/sodium antiporter n=1 Tax=Oculatella sp. LEGE 06141 TaxID=1828648 RepID=UPI001881DF41|nr:calcium/sodium antiporter [Oculatella sp. LEGE 06141]MBE9177282.1 calcium/sodium antiporter [Oculatella sp. LEGE 06141]
MSIAVLAFLLAGLVLLVLGAEALVRGASRLATLVGISPLIIGLTVVAYGTSAPEMSVSIIASFSGRADIALGNVVGSNIFNVLLILGLSSIIAPLVVSQQLIRLDVPIMIGVSILTLFFGLDGTINRSDGVVLFIGGIVYTGFLLYQSQRQSVDAALDEYSGENGQPQTASLQQWLINLGFIAVGLVALVVGSRWLVNSATAIAQAFGLSELIIGLTIVAAGTSLPELATSAIASLRGERDIAVGNVVGSNIFNLLAVLGLSSAISPDGVNVSAAALRFDLPVMVAVAIACLPIFFTGNLISRWEGFVFIGYYLAYTTYLILDATNHASLPIFSSVLLLFAIPLTVITLVIFTIRALRARQHKAKSR